MADLFRFKNIFSSSEFRQLYVDPMPENLIIVTLSYDEERGAIICSRMQKGQEPCIVIRQRDTLKFAWGDEKSQAHLFRRKADILMHRR